MTIHKLSIITINLNNKLGLQKTVNSVLSQTFTDFEYLIIDGGSTDGSVELIKENLEKITYWVSEPDSGIYNALNKGISKARGEYCLFLNSGDYLAKSDSLLNLFENKLIEDIVYWNTYLIDNRHGVKKIVQPDRLSASFFYGGTINHQSCIIKRDLFDEYGMYDESFKIASDWLFFLKTIVFGNVQTKHLNLFLTFFDGNGVSATMRQIALAENKKIINDLFSDCLKYDLDRLHEMDSTVWMLNKSAFHPVIKFLFKSVNKVISFFWIKKN